MGFRDSARDDRRAQSLPALCGTLRRAPEIEREESRKVGRKEAKERAIVRTWVGQMRLPQAVAETACDDLMGWLKDHTQRGTARRGAIVASIFHACKTRGTPVTSRELVKATGVPSRSVNEACRRMAAYIEGRRSGEGPSRPVRADDLLARCCERIMVGRDSAAAKGLLVECRQLCADRGDLAGLQGKTPAAVAAAAIRSVAKRTGLSLSKKQIALGCGVAVGTIDRCWKLMEERPERGAAGPNLEFRL